MSLNVLHMPSSRSGGRVRLASCRPGCAAHMIKEVIILDINMHLSSKAKLFR